MGFILSSSHGFAAIGLKASMVGTVVNSQQVGFPQKCLPLRIGLTVDGWTLGIQMNIRPSALFCVANETVDDVGKMGMSKEASCGVERPFRTKAMLSTSIILDRSRTEL